VASCGYTGTTHKRNMYASCHHTHTRIHTHTRGRTTQHMIDAKKSSLLHSGARSAHNTQLNTSTYIQGTHRTHPGRTDRKNLCVRTTKIFNSPPRHSITNTTDIACTGACERRRHTRTLHTPPTVHRRLPGSQSYRRSRRSPSTAGCIALCEGSIHM
jgi:hypothetical protein